MSVKEPNEDRFRACYAAHVRPLLGYALRRSSSAEVAADAVADTMLVAWRRIDEMPPEPETRLWLYGVARRVLANARRSERRQDRLAERLRLQLSTTVAQIEPSETSIVADVRAALHALSDIEREVLLLTATEQLSPGEIAVVLEMNPNTVRTHLHRARVRLRTELAKRNDDTGHEGAGRSAPRHAEQEGAPR